RPLPRALRGRPLRRGRDAVGGHPVARGRRASVGDHALDRRRAARHRLFRTAFAREVEWILLDGLAAIAAREGESLYLRLSTRPVSQALAPATTPEYRDAVLRGGYRLSDARDRSGYAADRAVHLFAAGVMVTEALEAARALAGHGVFANVFVVTSPDRLYRGLRAPRPWLETLVAADEEDVPVVSVLDGHSHALGFIGGALGVPQQALGVEDFGQS